MKKGEKNRPGFRITSGIPDGSGAWFNVLTDGVKPVLGQHFVKPRTGDARKFTGPGDAVLRDLHQVPQVLGLHRIAERFEAGQLRGGVCMRGVAGSGLLISAGSLNPDM